MTSRPVVSHLPNGITLVVQPEDVSDTVSVFGHIRNRPEVQAPAGQEGISSLSLNPDTVLETWLFLAGAAR